MSRPGSSPESVTPEVMHSWRVDALNRWIDKKTNNAEKALTMEMMSKCGHLDEKKIF